MRIKKSNIEIVKGYLAGERPFVQVGYQPPPPIRKEGDQWEDSRGIWWEQKHGYKVRVNKQADSIRAATVQRCSCGQNIQYGSRLDDKFFIKTGKCFECVIKEETELRVYGVFGHYENYKLLSNYLGYLEDTKQKIQDSIGYFERESGELSILCSGEGFLEKFQGLNSADLLKSAKKDLKEVCESINKVTKDKAKAKKIYESELAKARKRAVAAMKK